MLEMRTAADQLAVVMIRKVVVDLPAPDPAPATPKGRVTGAQALNIRSGPGVAFPVIGVARNGDEGEIVGRSADGRWWAVSLPAAPGGIGWASADFVLATNAENVPVIAAPPPPPPTPTPVRPPTATPAPPPPPTATPVPPAAPSGDAFGGDRRSGPTGRISSRVNAPRSTGRCKTCRRSGSILKARTMPPSHAPARAVRSFARPRRRPTRCACGCATDRRCSAR